MKKLKKSEMLRRGQVELFLSKVWIHLCIHGSFFLSALFGLFHRLSMSELKGIFLPKWITTALSNYIAHSRTVSTCTWSWSTSQEATWWPCSWGKTRWLKMRPGSTLARRFLRSKRSTGITTSTGMEQVLSCSVPLLICCLWWVQYLNLQRYQAW